MYNVHVQCDWFVVAFAVIAKREKTNNIFRFFSIVQCGKNQCRPCIINFLRPLGYHIDIDMSNIENIQMLIQMEGKTFQVAMDGDQFETHQMEEVYSVAITLP